MLKRATKDEHPNNHAGRRETDRQGDRLAEARELYDRYVKPLESEHRGEYVAVAPDGRLLMGPDELQVLRDGHTAFGGSQFIFRVGELAISAVR